VPLGPWSFRPDIVESARAFLRHAHVSPFVCISTELKWEHEQVIYAFTTCPLGGSKPSSLADQIPRGEGGVDRQIVSNHAIVKERLVALFPRARCHLVCWSANEEASREV